MFFRIKLISQIIFDFDGNHVNPILTLKQSVSPYRNMEGTYLNNLALYTRHCRSEKGREGDLGLLTPSLPLLPILLPTAGNFCLQTVRLQSPHTKSSCLGAGPDPCLPGGQFSSRWTVTAAGLKVGQLSLSSRMVTSRSAVPLSSPMSSASSSSSRTGGEKASRSMTIPDLTVTTPGTQHHRPGRYKGEGMQWGNRARATPGGTEKGKAWRAQRRKRSRESNTRAFFL